jgi:hypothetical protein
MLSAGDYSMLLEDECLKDATVSFQTERRSARIGNKPTMRSFGGNTGTSSSASCILSCTSPTNACHSYIEPTSALLEPCKIMIRSYLLRLPERRLVRAEPLPIVPLGHLEVDEEVECVLGYHPGWH